jgi:hypothetical protein
MKTLADLGKIEIEIFTEQDPQRPGHAWIDVNSWHFDSWVAERDDWDPGVTLAHADAMALRTETVLARLAASMHVNLSVIAHRHKCESPVITYWGTRAGCGVNYHRTDEEDESIGVEAGRWLAALSFALPAKPSGIAKDFEAAARDELTRILATA